MAGRRILIAFPFPGQTTAGGPEGFISQLLRPFDLPGVAVTPAAPAAGSQGLARRAQQLAALLTGAASRAGMSAADFAARRELFAASGMADASHLWFMDQGIFRLFAPFVRPGQFVIYQPHCPELPWEEIDGSTLDGARRRAEAEASTRGLLQRANLLVLPNAGVHAIYAGVLPAGTSIRHLQSGAARPGDVRPPPLDPRHTYLLYVGRRNAIKGFDLVLEAFRRAHARRPELRLLVCGNGPRVDHPAVIDIGFTNRIHDWIAAADFVVNANRQSYLDLSVMETLAVGTPLVMTCTHGHEIFRAWAGPGLRPISRPDVDACTDALLACRADESRDPAVRAANRDLFDREFAVARYHERVVAFARDVLAASS